MPNIFKAMCDIQDEISSISKSSKNAQQGFNFRGIDSVYNELHGLFSKHRVLCVPVVTSDKSEERQTRNGGTLIYRILTVKYVFTADDGSTLESIVIGEGMDSGDKASNKAMSIAHKYALLQVFTIPTCDQEDPDRESHDIVQKQERLPHSEPFSSTECKAMCELYHYSFEDLKKWLGERWPEEKASGTSLGKMLLEHKDEIVARIQSNV